MKIPVIFASMSGNSQFIAEQVDAKISEAASHDSDLLHADSATLETLQGAEGPVIFVIPTWGEGELPADAENLFAAIEAEAEDALAGVKFGLIALGDSAYPDFCAGGLALADALKSRGAAEAIETLKLDGIPVEKYADDVDAWVKGLLAGA